MNELKKSILEVLQKNSNESYTAGSCGELGEPINAVHSDNYAEVADSIVSLMVTEQKRHCCHIDCNSSASHSIIYSKGVDDYYDFCRIHLSTYLPNDKEVKVAPIEY